MEPTRLKLHSLPRDHFDWRLNLTLVVAVVAAELLLFGLLALLGPVGMWLTQALMVALIVRLFQITLVRVDVTDEGLHAVGLLGWGRLEQRQPLSRYYATTDEEQLPAQQVTSRWWQ